MAVLEARGLTVSYGGLHANEGIDLQCHAGQLVGLGPQLLAVAAAVTAGAASRRVTLRPRRVVNYTTDTCLTLSLGWWSQQARRLRAR